MKKILFIYSYVFYRFYDIAKFSGNYNDGWITSHFMSNIFTFSLYVLIGFIFEINDYTFAAYFCLFMYFVLISINYFIFIKDDKYKIIVNNFNKESSL